jgi:PRTRC genetic system protein A
MKPTETDLYLQRCLPTVAVPAQGEFEPLHEPGDRLLVARDGLWLESRRAWGYVRAALAQSPVALNAYGPCTASMRMSFDPMALWIVERFAADAAATWPYESAAVVVQGPGGSLEYRRCDTLEATESYVRARRPALGPDESVVLDLHSHPCCEAAFSAVDRRDFGSEFVVAGVLGREGSSADGLGGLGAWRYEVAIFARGAQIAVGGLDVVVGG